MLISQRPTLSEESLAPNRSQFVIEPLEPGFGYTLGNSLRRTLLSSIPGAAVTSIRIDGVLHEFTTVPGVKEDVTDMILNLKGLVVSSEEDEPVTMYLRKQGPGEVTAGDIVPPAGVTVHGYRTIDDRRAADLVLRDLRLPAAALLTDDAAASLEQARDEGAAAVCAEAVGAMRKVLADTVEYCKQRQQFGQPIGGFQVLQHRMVDMYLELEQAVSAAYLAVLNLDAEPATRARAVSAAKATVGRAARFIGQNAVQLHGGMGMTEELAIGHYFKRLTALQYEFGSTDQHRTRYAALTRP